MDLFLLLCLQLLALVTVEGLVSSRSHLQDFLVVRDRFRYGGLGFEFFFFLFLLCSLIDQRYFNNFIPHRFFLLILSYRSLLGLRLLYLLQSRLRLGKLVADLATVLAVTYWQLMTLCPSGAVSVL